MLASQASVRDEFDFETEEEEAKNTDEYSKYPLPFVIGSRQFKEEEYAGLFLPSDHEDGTYMQPICRQGGRVVSLGRHRIRSGVG